MGKRKEVNIEPWESKSEDTAPEPVKSAIAQIVVSELVVGLPVADRSEERIYVSRHVDVKLDRVQAGILNRILVGMDIAGERLNNGKRVVNKMDAIRRVLEIAADSVK